MRDILFRGKRILNDAWVEGALLRCDNGDIYIATAMEEPSADGESTVTACSLVFSDTVGQCIPNLSDNNGNKIFEGDIVKVQMYSPNSDFNVCKVVFNEKTGGFELWWNAVVGVYGEKATHKINFAGSKAWTCFEVLGNIYDNQELLEV